MRWACVLVCRCAERRLTPHGRLMRGHPTSHAHNDAVCTTVVTAGDCAETLLPSCVPLQNRSDNKVRGTTHVSTATQQTCTTVHTQPTYNCRSGGPVCPRGYCDLRIQTTHAPKKPNRHPLPLVVCWLRRHVAGFPLLRQVRPLSSRPLTICSLMTLPSSSTVRIFCKQTSHL